MLQKVALKTVKLSVKSYIRTMTTRVQWKKIVVVGIKGLGAKTN
jgi:hypothetical protein